MYTADFTEVNGEFSVIVFNANQEVIAILTGEPDQMVNTVKQNYGVTLSVSVH